MSDAAAFARLTRALVDDPPPVSREGGVIRAGHDALRDELAPQCVLDGEVVVPREIDGRIRLDWDSLSQRIHPAESRVRMLAEQTPAHFIGFDALATGDTSLMGSPFRERRDALSDLVRAKQWCHVTRTTEDPDLGVRWLSTFEGAGLDGVFFGAGSSSSSAGGLLTGMSVLQPGQRTFLPARSSPTLSFLAHSGHVICIGASDDNSARS